MFFVFFVPFVVNLFQERQSGMTIDIEFSIMASSSAGIQPLLDRFAAETGIQVRLRLLAWDSAWSMFVRSALYGDGPDVSEIGTTWVGDLIGMNALRPFDAAEIAALGRPAAFFPAAWQIATRTWGTSRQNERAWSIPWLTGARLIFYRPALLQQAGIDPQTAFGSHTHFSETVRRLQDAGVPVPWTVPTGYTHTTLLNIASWVWAAGGDFLSLDGRATAFARAEALEGMRAYFGLGRFISPSVQRLNGLQPDEFFLTNPDTAMTISGPWVFCGARQMFGDPSEPLGVALPPGASFVGGSNLIVWKHTRYPDAAVRLVRFLTQHAAQLQYSQVVGLMPARLETLASAPFSTDPSWMTAVRGLQSGRTFLPVRLWGLVEDRLTAGFSAVWPDVLAGIDPEEALEKHLMPLAGRLDPLLAKE